MTMGAKVGRPRKDTTANVTVAIRITQAQADTPDRIAVEKGWVGGPGSAPDMANRSDAFRELAKIADPRMAEHDIDLAWSRNG